MPEIENCTTEGNHIIEERLCKKGNKKCCGNDGECHCAEDE